MAELLLLSDRYEVDSLKQACEYALHSSIDQDSVLYFLSMADQYNAQILKVGTEGSRQTDKLIRLFQNECLNYLSQHQELTESEVFFELPIVLQAEVFDCVWTQPAPRKSTTMEQLLPTSATPTSADSSISEVQRAMYGLHLNQEVSNNTMCKLEQSCQIFFEWVFKYVYVTVKT